MWKMGETNEECRVRVEERTNNHSGAWHMDEMTGTNTLSQCRVTWHYKCAQTREKGDVWGVLFTHPVGCSRVLPQQFFSKKMSSTSFHSTATMRYWKKKKKKTNATFGIDEKGWVLVVLLLILGGDGSLMWLRFGSLIGVSSVHFCPICSVRYQCFWYLSYSSKDRQLELSSCATLSIAMHFTSV